MREITPVNRDYIPKIGLNIPFENETDEPK